MADSNLKRFMRPEMKADEAFEVKIKDKDGKDMMIKIRRLPRKIVNEIRDAYTTKEIAYDKKGNPIFRGQRLVMTESRDEEKYLRHLLCEALVIPKLNDPELMEFFGCVDMTDMPDVVFTQPELIQVINEYTRIANYEPMGEEDVDAELVNEAKNS